MKLRKILSIVLSLLMVMSLAACGSSGDAVSGGEDEGFVSPFETAKEGTEMPDFSMELLSGETFTLSEHQGRVVLVNFWATWCGPCVGELPDFQQLQQDYAEDLVILAVNCGEDAKAVESFLAENGYTFAVCADEAYRWGGFLTGIPYTVVIGPDGTVAATQLGGGAGMYSHYAEIVEALI